MSVGDYLKKENARIFLMMMKMRLKCEYRMNEEMSVGNCDEKEGDGPEGECPKTFVTIM